MIPGSEAHLIARCRQGDAEAWDAFFDQHYAPTGRFLFQVSSEFTAEDIEELCQEVFLSVIKSISAFDGRSQIQTWICRIALNKARDFREKRNASKRGGGRVPVSLDQSHPEHGPAPDPASSAPGPDGQLIRTEQYALLQGALDQIGEPCREIIQLRYFADLSYQEIGEALRLNEKTVSSRLSKCLDRLEALVRPVLRGSSGPKEKSASFPV